MTPYQFVILRYRRSASAGELVNIGIIMWIPGQSKLTHMINDRYGRLSKFYPGFDGHGYRQIIEQLNIRFERLARDLSDPQLKLRLSSSKISDLDDLLPILIAEDASCLQVSDIMAGVVQRPDERLGRLFWEMVQQYESHKREQRTEIQVWNNVEQQLRRSGLAERVNRGIEIRGQNYAYQFKVGWPNSVPQVLEPIAFDLAEERSILEKAAMWSGRLYNLSKGSKFQMTGVVTPPQDHSLDPAFSSAVSILRDAPNMRQIITEDEIDKFLPEIERDIEEAAKATEE